MVKQELYCHECTNYVQFVLDEEVNGNHIITCPICGHEHCRTVRDGNITDDRWDTRNKIVINGNLTTASAVSTYTTYTSGTTVSSTVGTATDYIMYTAWLNATTAC